MRIANLINKQTKSCARDRELYLSEFFPEVCVTLIADVAFQRDTKGSTGPLIPKAHTVDVIITKRAELVSKPSELYTDLACFDSFWIAGSGELELSQYKLFVRMVKDAISYSATQAQQRSLRLRQEVF